MTTRQPSSESDADIAQGEGSARPVPVLTRRVHALCAIALAVAAAVWAVVGSASLLPELSANSDEGIYLLQADALKSGLLAPAAPADDPGAYRPWFSVVRDGSYVLKYAPVHASVIAAFDAVTTSPRAALGAIAAAQVLLVITLAREMGASRRAALIAGALFATAPLVLQLDLTFLSYGTSLSLLLAASAAALRARRTRARAPALVAGFCWGFAAFARPYDAALFGLALTAALAWPRLRAGSRPEPRRRLVRLAGLACLGALVPLAALLAFNQAMTGDALRLPFHLLERRDAPGLGLRRALPSDTFLDYDLGKALSSLGRNLLLVSVWSAGGLLGCGLAAATLVRRRLRHAALSLAILAVWPVGYALFWGSYVAAFLWDGALFLGPFYYLPMVAALAIPAGVALDDLWHWRPPLAAVAAVGSAALVVALVAPRLAEQHERSEQRSEVADAVADEVESPALVFIPPLYGPFLQNPLSFLRNSAEIGGPVVYALDRGDAANDKVRAAHPTRRAYRLVLVNGWSDQPGFEPIVTINEMGASGARQ